MVYDAIFNPRVAEQCEKDPALFQFVVSIVIDRIFQRFKHELSTNITKMKNFTYKGKNLRPQRVKVRKGPKIEEILKNDSGTNRDSDFLNNRNMAREINKQINENSKTPDWNFLVVKNPNINIGELQNIMINPASYLSRRFTFKEFEANETNDLMFFDNSNATPKHGYGLFYLVELNLLAKSSGVNLNVSDDGFILTCGSIYKLLISFPYKVDAKNSYSYFDAKTRFLYSFFSFFKEDVLIFRNEKQIGQNNDGYNQSYREVVKIGIQAHENGKEEKINIENKNKNVKEGFKKQNIEDISEKITDDYLYDVIV